MINVTKYCDAVVLFLVIYNTVLFNREGKLKRTKIIILKAINSKYPFNLTCKLFDPTVNIKGKG